MDESELKRKLRELKKLEASIRFPDAAEVKGIKLVWTGFFSIGEVNDGKARYSLRQLLNMDRQELKEVIDEYFTCVYFQKYKENGITFSNIYDPNLLALLGLSPVAGLEEIKRKFRELAKKYHPDHGGSSSDMMELLETYHKLISK